METFVILFTQQVLLVLVAVSIFGGLAYLWLQDQMRALEAEAVRVRR